MTDSKILRAFAHYGVPRVQESGSSQWIWVGIGNIPDHQYPTGDLLEWCNAEPDRVFIDPRCGSLELTASDCRRLADMLLSIACELDSITAADAPTHHAGRCYKHPGVVPYTAEGFCARCSIEFGAPFRADGD